MLKENKKAYFSNKRNKKIGKSFPMLYPVIIFLIFLRYDVHF